MEAIQLGSEDIKTLLVTRKEKKNQRIIDPLFGWITFDYEILFIVL